MVLKIRMEYRDCDVVTKERQEEILSLLENLGCELQTRFDSIKSESISKLTETKATVYVYEVPSKTEHLIKSIVKVTENYNVVYNWEDE